MRVSMMMQSHAVDPFKIHFQRNAYTHIHEILNFLWPISLWLQISLCRVYVCECQEDERERQTERVPSSSVFPPGRSKQGLQHGKLPKQGTQSPQRSSTMSIRSGRCDISPS